MNNIEKNALRIAELDGWELSNIDRKLIRNNLFENKSKVISYYSDYNGLMPIVFEIYASKNFTINIYKWVSRCVLLAYNDKDNTNWGHEPIAGNYRYDFSNDKITEPEFIEAIQLAVIKYLELKNE